MFKIRSSIIFFLLCCSCAFSQIKKGDQLAANANYIRAIDKYKKAAKGNSPYKQEAYLKLADCYKKINDYSDMKKYFLMAIEKGN
ncbi:MAG: hypothetical protein ACXVO9_06845, partial [Bacteroidia bacterium]